MKKFDRLKSKNWFPFAVALCIAVVLFAVLQHLGAVWNLIKLIWDIISPLVAAVIIAYIIDPLVRLWERTIFKNMKKRNYARYLSVALSIILILVFIAALLYILVPQLITSIESLAANISEYMGNLKQFLNTFAGGLFSQLFANVDFDNLGTNLVKILTGIVAGEDLVKASVTFGSGLVSGVISGVISVILAIYFLLGKDRMVRFVKKFWLFVLKKKRYVPFITFCANCNQILVRYICYTLLEALAVGVANAILMLIFGLPYIPIISLTVGVLNLAPTFGPIAGGAIGAFILIMVNPWYALIFIIITIALQMADGYVLKPRLFSGQLGVSAILILISIIVFGRIFGVLGMLMAIPIAAIIQYLVKELMARRNRKPEEEYDEEDEYPEEPPAEELPRDEEE